MTETQTRPDIDGEPLEINDQPPGEWSGPELFRALVNLGHHQDFYLAADHDSGDDFGHLYDSPHGTFALEVKVGESAVDVTVYHDPPPGWGDELPADTEATIETAGRTATDSAWTIWERCDLPGMVDDR